MDYKLEAHELGLYDVREEAMQSLQKRQHLQAALSLGHLLGAGQETQRHSRHMQREHLEGPAQTAQTLSSTGQATSVASEAGIGIGMGMGILTAVTLVTLQIRRGISRCETQNLRAGEYLGETG